MKVYTCYQQKHDYEWLLFDEKSAPEAIFIVMYRHSKKLKKRRKRHSNINVNLGVQSINGEPSL